MYKRQGEVWRGGIRGRGMKRGVEIDEGYQKGSGERYIRRKRDWDVLKDDKSGT